MKSSRTARAASVTAIILAIYEAVAIFTNEVPTITEFLEGGPELIELTVIGGVMLWLAHHFGWFSRLLKLMGR